VDDVDDRAEASQYAPPDLDPPPRGLVDDPG